MDYPFLHHVGDRVTIRDGGTHDGKAGTVHALELSARKTLAIVHITTGESLSSVRFLESDLRRLSS